MRTKFISAIMIVLGLLTHAAHAQITYFVNRQLDQGFVSGTITTDGTIGVITGANIIDWELTLSAPNLAGGPVYTIDFATQAQTNISGLATTATATELMFDISGASGEGFFLLQGTGTGPGNYYCIETAGAACTGGGVGEHMGRATSGTVAQTGLPTGNFVFATTTVDPITYCVDRQIGGGSVVGSITTDGKLGVITGANIIDWELTLMSPNLAGGPTETISSDNQIQTVLTGSVTTATATGLFFDMTGASGDGMFLTQGASENYWCIETALGGCTGLGIGEYIGFNANGNVDAESALPAGNFRFATNCLADFDGSGSLDFFDVSAFITAFTTQQSSGDLNADGSWNFFDVSIFLSAYNSGCP